MIHGTTDHVHVHLHVHVDSPRGPFASLFFIYCSIAYPKYRILYHIVFTTSPAQSTTSSADPLPFGPDGRRKTEAKTQLKQKLREERESCEAGAKLNEITTKRIP